MSPRHAIVSAIPPSASLTRPPPPPRLVPRRHHVRRWSSDRRGWPSGDGCAPSICACTVPAFYGRRSRPFQALTQFFYCIRKHINHLTHGHSHRAIPAPIGTRQSNIHRLEKDATPLPSIPQDRCTRVRPFQADWRALPQSISPAYDPHNPKRFSGGVACPTAASDRMAPLPSGQRAPLGMPNVSCASPLYPDPAPSPPSSPRPRSVPPCLRGEPSPPSPHCVAASSYYRANSCFPDKMFRRTHWCSFVFIRG